MARPVRLPIAFAESNARSALGQEAIALGPWCKLIDRDDTAA
jgi:hypothetical protein